MSQPNVLSQKLGAGPHGLGKLSQCSQHNKTPNHDTRRLLGDPNDRQLRKVEKEVLIPKIMRERAKTHKCTTEVAAFESCCKQSGLLMAFGCRPQNEALRDCQTLWYGNDEFIGECTEIYLKRRSEYRRTGLTVKQREAAAATVQANAS